MGRKTSEKPSQIWSFWALPPTTGVEVVRETLYLASRYYNDLVALKRREMEAYAEIRRRHVPGLAALEKDYREADDEVMDLLRQVRSVRSATRKRDVLPDLRASLAAAQARRKAAAALFKTAREAFEETMTPARESYKKRKAEMVEAQESASGITAPAVRARINEHLIVLMATEPWPEPWQESKQLELRTNQARKDLRSRRPIAAGPGGLVEEAVDRAIKMSRPAPPKFHRFSGDGRVGFQIRDGGCTTAEMLGKHPQIRLRKVPSKNSRWRHGDEFYVVSMNIGTSVPGEERWCDWPVRLHRPLPTDAVVKYAWVLARRQGMKIRWQLQLNIEAASLAKPKRPSGIGRVAVNFGWRDEGDAIRVATWIGDDGHRGALLLPRAGRGEDPRKAIVDRLDTPAALRAAADTCAFIMSRRLRLWLRLSGNRLHGWDRLRRDDRRRALWRFASAWAEHELGTTEVVAKLWGHWKEHRLPRHEDLFVVWPSACRPWLRETLRRIAPERPWGKARATMAWWVYLWARKDEHLRQYEADMRRRSEAQRNAIYRKMAIFLATRYDTLVTDTAKMSDLARTPDEEDLDAEHQNAKASHNRFLVAPGTARSILRETFGKQREIRVPAEHNTTHCSACHAKLSIEADRVSCPSCGTPGHIDENNCKNLLNRASGEWSGAVGSGGTARKAGKKAGKNGTGPASARSPGSSQ